MLYNVLIVEDDRRMAHSLAAQISVLGHTVVIAYGPRMALQQLNEVIPDVIFMDINMPGINGLEVLRYLQRDPKTRTMPVVIVSADDQESAQTEAFEAGAGAYIVKPPTMENIEAALAKVVRIELPESVVKAAQRAGVELPTTTITVPDSPTDLVPQLPAPNSVNEQSA